VCIRDSPRFQWRGGHLDVCRHFFPLETVKAYIDWLVLHKLNVFHWHLTDDQGWRLEIKKYPKLTEIGAWRGDGAGGKYGGFYTQEEAREIVAYAAERHITVVPEIEVLGHAVATLAAYPELGCLEKEISVETTWGIFDDVYCPGKERLFEFLGDVFEEICEIFPSIYIHVGGDECPKTRWKECPQCQKRMTEEGLADEEALQSYTIGRVDKLLIDRGRKMIGWDEIMEGGLAPQATVMSWRGEEGGITAARGGHDVIMCPNSHCYLDHKQIDDPAETVGRPMDVCSLENCYAYEPLPPALSREEAKHVLGSQANLWSEYVRKSKELEYAMFPRLCALAEVFWSAQDGRNFEDFKNRLQGHVKLLASEGVAYCDKDI
jgi:hexosaminidase